MLLFGSNETADGEAGAPDRAFGSATLLAINAGDGGSDGIGAVLGAAVLPPPPHPQSATTDTISRRGLLSNSLPTSNANRATTIPLFIDELPRKSVCPSEWSMSIAAHRIDTHGTEDRIADAK
jgi:hypothetical protein